MLKVGPKFFWALTPSVKRALVWQFFLPGKALGPGRPKITSPWPLASGGTSFGNSPALSLYPTPKEYPLNSWGTKSYILKLQWWCLSVTGLYVLHNPVTVSMAELCGPAGGEHVCASVCASDDGSAF